jgi:hypothetical protein
MKHDKSRVSLRPVTFVSPFLKLPLPFPCEPRLWRIISGAR